MMLHGLCIINIVYLAAAVREIPYITSTNDANGETQYEIKISQPQVKVYKADQYTCFTQYFEDIDEAYILKGFIEFDRRYIHHVSTGFCGEPEDFAKHGPWECSSNRYRMCPGDAVSGIATDAYTKASRKYTAFPKDVSIKIGFMTKLRYLTYEAHFKGPVTDPTYPLVNITFTFVKSPYFYQASMLLTSGYIPARTEKCYFADIACPWTKPEVAAFAVVLHTHHNGYMAELFRIRNGTWTLLAGQLTQGKSRNLIPIIRGKVDIKPGDILAARCLYINDGNKSIEFGLGDDDEMCNVTIDYGYESKDERFFTKTGACATDIPEYSFCTDNNTLPICGKLG